MMRFARPVVRSVRGTCSCGGPHAISRRDATDQPTVLAAGVPAQRWGVGLAIKRSPVRAPARARGWASCSHPCVSTPTVFVACRMEPLSRVHLTLLLPTNSPGPATHSQRSPPAFSVVDTCLLVHFHLPSLRLPSSHTRATIQHAVFSRLPQSVSSSPIYLPHHVT